MSDHTLQSLVGCVVQGVFVNEDQTLLVFQTDQGIKAFRAEGDCCSETWFADITGVPLMLGSTVTEVRDLDVPKALTEAYAKDGRTRQQYDEVYGYVISGRTGGWQKHFECQIIYRNSSNGYYSGWCKEVEAPSLDQALSPIAVDDWSATT